MSTDRPRPAPSRRDFLKTSHRRPAVRRWAAPGARRPRGRQRHDQGRPDRLRRPRHRRRRAVVLSRRAERQARRAGRRLPGPPRRLPQTQLAQEAELAHKVDVPHDRCFVGFDAYQKVHRHRRRPRHPGHAARLPARSTSRRRSTPGKHVFTEKPVAVDGPGIRTVLAAAEEAKKKKLGVVAGTQRRHQAGYLETHEADPRRRDRRHRRRRAATGTRAALWSKRAQAELDRHGVAAPQLALLHLALGRPHRRAARPQPRRHQLGHRAPTRSAPSAWAAARSAPAPSYGHIFDHFADRLRVSRTASTS